MEGCAADANWRCRRHHALNRNTRDAKALMSRSPRMPAVTGASSGDTLALASTCRCRRPYGFGHRPKGVMLSHHNILWNAQAVLQLVPDYLEDVYLSFLPLSHAFERTVGYYLPPGHDGQHGGVRTFGRAAGRGSSHGAAYHAGLGAADL